MRTSNLAKKHCLKMGSQKFVFFSLVTMALTSYFDKYLVVLIASFDVIRNYNQIIPKIEIRVENDKYLFRNLHQFQDICEHVHFYRKKMSKMPLTS